MATAATPIGAETLCRPPPRKRGPSVASPSYKRVRLRWFGNGVQDCRCGRDGRGRGRRCSATGVQLTLNHQRYQDWDVSTRTPHLSNPTPRSVCYQMLVAASANAGEGRGVAPVLPATTSVSRLAACSVLNSSGVEKSLSVRGLPHLGQTGVAVSDLQVGALHPPPRRRCRYWRPLPSLPEAGVSRRRAPLLACRWTVRRSMKCASQGKISRSAQTKAEPIRGSTLHRKGTSAPWHKWACG